MKIGDLVRKFTSIKGVYNYGIVTEVLDNSKWTMVRVAWANSNPKNPWIMSHHIEVVNESR